MGLALSLEDRYANEKALVQNRYQVEHYPEVAIMLYRKTGAEHPDLANSALCLYLAICEFEDTRWTRHENRVTQEALFSIETRSRHRNKTRAFTLLAE
jgi:hypothetical protein